ncbi:MAG: hypothetical protein JXN59_15560 [Anaerolineae bacterium]|nr:hypothetical protein [Anaerolineae bacterium]
MIPTPSPRREIPSDHQGALVAAVIMMLVGWLGLFQLVTHTLPLAFPRWLFFILLFSAVTGTAIPIVRYLNVRLTSRPYAIPSGSVIVRQSIWVGLFAVTCAWLQIPRVLNPPVAFFLGLSFGVIEVYLRLRERSEEGSID